MPSQERIAGIAQKITIKLLGFLFSLSSSQWSQDILLLARAEFIKYIKQLTTMLHSSSNERKEIFCQLILKSFQCMRFVMPEAFFDDAYFSLSMSGEELSLWRFCKWKFFRRVSLIFCNFVSGSSASR